MQELLNKIAIGIEKGNKKAVLEDVQAALDANIKVESIMNDGLIKGMEELGAKWKRNEVFVPEVLIAARTLTAALEAIKPILAQQGVKPKGKAVIGTVKGDLHDIGKNLVKMMMVGAGFEVVDLGVDVSEAKFIEALEENQPDILLLSALLTTTMPQQKAVIDAITAAQLRDKVKIMVGGAPVTQEFADEIGADAYTQDAASAAERAVKFVS
ncbi:cobalamin B12-binding domain-containing protein [Anaerotalea alkaliphila]|uniref:Cobalamin-binding protein n=1 Tax=Anaerotalea alkaliphila TaxID=2662126 RepID=A0A7X5KNZ5_9FIRM|nr:cobalamin-dependent protein [Anaerotalea alkaliphila]NDL68343.1 cobalamin-binding protein [Anaerotalea alkaliphila]